jgi:hypothetical protein
MADAARRDLPDRYGRRPAVLDAVLVIGAVVVCLAIALPVGFVAGASIGWLFPIVGAVYGPIAMVVVLVLRRRTSADEFVRREPLDHDLADHRAMRQIVGTVTAGVGLVLVVAAALGAVLPEHASWPLWWLALGGAIPVSVALIVADAAWAYPARVRRAEAATLAAGGAGARAIRMHRTLAWAAWIGGTVAAWVLVLSGAVTDWWPLTN